MHTTLFRSMCAQVTVCAASSSTARRRRRCGTYRGTCSPRCTCSTSRWAATRATAASSSPRASGPSSCGTGCSRSRRETLSLHALHPIRYTLGPTLTPALTMTDAGEAAARLVHPTPHTLHPLPTPHTLQPAGEAAARRLHGLQALPAAVLGATDGGRVPP